MLNKTDYSGLYPILKSFDTLSDESLFSNPNLLWVTIKITLQYNIIIMTEHIILHCCTTCLAMGMVDSRQCSWQYKAQEQRIASLTTDNYSH